MPCVPHQAPNSAKIKPKRSRKEEKKIIGKGGDVGERVTARQDLFSRAKLLKPPPLFLGGGRGSIVHCVVLLRLTHGISFARGEYSSSEGRRAKEGRRIKHRQKRKEILTHMHGYETNMPRVHPRLCTSHTRTAIGVTRTFRECRAGGRRAGRRR